MTTRTTLRRRPFREGRGGNISITMTTTAEVRDGGLSVHLTVSNTGDEAASSVVPILRFDDHEARGTRQETLAPNQSFDDTLTVPQVALGPGRWPFRVAVDYTDQNQYPFQALHVGLITVGNPAPARLAISAVKVPAIVDSGSVVAQVKNLSAAAREVNITLFVPEGLEVTEGATRM